MRNVLAVASLAELVTGAALIFAPSPVSWLLLGQELAGIAVPVARVTGIALVGLGLACWPGPPRLGMLAYGGGVAIVLAWQGLGAGIAGPLLWPAVFLHAALSLAVAAEFFLSRRSRSGTSP